jgi:hypothetical protein
VLRAGSVRPAASSPSPPPLLSRPSLREEPYQIHVLCKSSGHTYEYVGDDHAARHIQLALCLVPHSPPSPPPPPTVPNALKPLHCRLHDGRNPSTMSNAAPSSKEQVVANRHALRASVTDHGVVCGGGGSADLHSHRPPLGHPAASVTSPGGGACRWQRGHH